MDLRKGINRVPTGLREKKEDIYKEDGSIIALAESCDSDGLDEAS